MIVKIITNILFIFLLGGLQIAFISSLPGWLGSINLVLVVLIFILGFASFNFTIWWSLGIGLMLEIFSFLSFGVYLVSLSLTIVAASVLLNYFFTNRSLYSFLALSAIATLVYQLIVNFLALVATEVDNFFLIKENFWVLTLKQVAMNLLVTLFIYYLVHFLGRNLRPVFLIKKGKY